MGFYSRMRSISNTRGRDPVRKIRHFEDREQVGIAPTPSSSNVDEQKDLTKRQQRERYPCNFDSNQYPNFYFTTRGNKIDLISDEGDVLFAVEQLIKDARIVLAIRERRRPLNIDEEWEKNECDQETASLRSRKTAERAR
ncbi:hypothetical protein HPP92_022373 [Vanilla planifolia]|uniref:Uncharacterized protein n=1 Tax=Vanilla planifolia TaxID=51239 RepID=A0A835PS35_VANPL|nr:hypothetical protein HPP92_022373 [Vanilla planifolia]